MPSNQSATEKNADARRVLEHLYRTYEQCGHRNFYVEFEDADDLQSILGLTRARYRGATERLVDKGLLKHAGLRAFSILPAGVEAFEDEALLDSTLPIGPSMRPVSTGGREADLATDAQITPPWRPTPWAFISAAMRGLEPLRLAAQSACLRARVLPVGMESWSASSSDSLEACKKYVRQCDVVILVLAHRYGTLDAESKKSITELEYDEAKTAGKPVLVFFAKATAQDPAALDLDDLARLKAFRDRIGRDMRGEADDSRHLETLVVQALHEWRSEVESGAPFDVNRAPPRNSASMLNSEAVRDSMRDLTERAYEALEHAKRGVISPRRTADLRGRMIGVPEPLRDVARAVLDAVDTVHTHAEDLGKRRWNDANVEPTPMLESAALGLRNALERLEQAFQTHLVR